MREIDLTGSSTPARVTVLSYGSLRSGKTRFAAGFPRPLFLSDNTESGWETIRHMHPSYFFEEDRPPRIWAIERVADMMKAIGDAEGLIASGEILTIVVDSLTFYNDLYLAFLVKVAASGDRAVDMRRVYGDLGAHLRELRIRVHNLPVNVVWLCLDKVPEDLRDSGPMISGQQASKFTAGCDYIFYHRSFQSTLDGPLQFEIRTRRWRQYPAGGRDEGLLPDPLGYWGPNEDGTESFVTDCTYRSFAAALGLPTTVPEAKPIGAARI